MMDTYRKGGKEMFRVGLVTILATVVAWTPLDEPKNARTIVGQAELAAAIEHTAQPQRRDWDWRGRIDRGDAIEISAGAALRFISP